MAAYGYSEHKNAVLKRLSRAEGQVRGVTRMVEQDTYCTDVITQISAAQSALDKIAIELIRDHARHCMQQLAQGSEEANSKADELVKAVSRLI